MEWPGIEPDTRARCSRVKGRLKVSEEREDSLEGGCRDGERAIGDVADMWALHGRLAEMIVLVVKGEERDERVERGDSWSRTPWPRPACACLRVVSESESDLLPDPLNHHDSTPPDMATKAKNERVLEDLLRVPGNGQSQTSAAWSGGEGPPASRPRQRSSRLPADPSAHRSRPPFLVSRHRGLRRL